MKWRKFAERLLRFSAPEPTPPAHPVQAAYQDAHMLLTAIYAGKSHSRRAWERIGQARWERATDLLRQAGIVDKRGGYVFDYTRDLERARADLLDAANAEATRRNNKNYVTARK